MLPRKATAHSAITRPRYRGSAVSWRVVLPTARNVTLVAPTTARATSARATVGAAAATRIAPPNVAAAIVSAGRPVRPLRATTSPPTIAPAPMAEVSSA